MSTRREYHTQRNALTSQRKTGDQRAEMNACLVLGGAYKSLRQYDDAILYSKKCIDIAKETW